jgi:hypothetical protein
MIDKSKLIPVRNRNNGRTGYYLSNSRANRTWERTGQVMNIPFGELQELQWTDGGDFILKNLLIVEDKEALEELNMSVEPEYYYTEKDVEDILLGTTQESLDRLEDLLNFAPTGVIELAKDIAVKKQIPDIRKRDLISKKTGFNVSKAIEINITCAPDETAEPDNKKVERKVSVSASTAAAPSAPVRKVTVAKK